MRRFLKNTGTVLEMIKFQHTVFALPFAIVGMLLAAGGLPPWNTVFWIVAACVFARTAAMSFNRWTDAHYDARNPRTASRAIPAGILPPGFVLLFAIASAALFVFSAAMLNPLALALSPVALVVLFGYSLAKRFTFLSHFILGLALGIAPIGAWIAVRGEFALEPLLIGLAVLLWTAGFDLIYSCQDYEVDRREGLYSVPARFGIPAALRLSAALHLLCLIVLVIAGAIAGLHWIYYSGIAVVAGLLLAEHRIVNPSDLSRIDVAFFTVNSWVGVAVLLFTALDLFLLG